MKFIKSIGILTFALLLNACFSQGLIPRLTDPEARIVMEGYSLTPTNQPGWLVVRRSNINLILARQSGKPDEYYSINATVARLKPDASQQEFLDLVRDAVEAEMAHPRTNIVSHEITLRDKPGPNCALSKLLIEGLPAVEPDDEVTLGYIDLARLVCVHPEDAEKVISVSFFQHYREGQQTQNFTRRSNKVLNSVEFEPL